MQPFPSDVAARLTELAPRLLDQLDPMTDRMIEVLLRTEPSYRELCDGEDDLRAGIRLNLERGLQALLGAASGSGASSLRAAWDVGRRRAAQGIPLEAVLRAYRLGGQVTWEALLEVSRQSSRENDTLLLEVAGSVWRTNDVECGAVAEGYREEQRRLAEVDDAARQHVLDGLLDGRGGDPAFVRTASQALAVPLDGRLVVVVALPGGDGAPALDAPTAALLKRGIRSVWGTRSETQVGIVALGSLPGCEAIAWLRDLAAGPVGVSAVVVGAAAAGSAYRLAETAAR